MRERRRTLVHVALEADGRINVFDVWDSQEAFDAFGETLLPILAELGVDRRSDADAAFATSPPAERKLGRGALERRPIGGDGKV